MPGRPSRIKRPGISGPTLKSLLFVFLIGIAISFWIYTQTIINHVRMFQKTMVNTQKDIYVNIINPFSSDVSSVDSDLFQTGVIDSPFPIIFSDETNEPIRGLWKNVGVDPNDTSEEALKKIRRLMGKMDRINPPDTISTPALKHRVDTLTVYEMPSSRTLPFAITDQIGTILYHRNVRIEPNAPAFQNLRTVTELDTIPKHFTGDNEPPLVVYGMSGKRRWPLVITKPNGDPLYWSNVNIAENDTSTTAMRRLKNRIRSMSSRGLSYEIVTNYVSGYNIQLFHYGDPRFLTWIAWLPVIEFIVLFILISVGFIGYKSIAKAEQRSIWVGMAKETAHQLGTPISSIKGWLELLKTERDDKLIGEAVREMIYDVDRLTRVASRFSNIGSTLELQPIVVSDVIEEVLDYFRSRVPRMRRSIVLESRYDNLSQVMGNRELLNWAFENLVKNSLVSIGREDGLISVRGMMTKNYRHIILDFKDNGCGIAPADQNLIMKPGFTTKKRGWGLGLSLVKRIIEEYHSGTITLLESKPDVATTFRIVLPAIGWEGKKGADETKDTLG